MSIKNEQGYYTGGNLTGQQARSNFSQGFRDTFPLGGPISSYKTGNPYLDQVKAIDKELKRLNNLAEKALKGSDNKSRDLKILNDQLRRSGELKRNALGIDRRFWARRTLQDQMRALQARRNKLTDFLGKENVLLGDTVPKIKGFTPTFIKDQDSHGEVSKINSYYLPFFNEAKKKKDRAAYDTIRSDLTSGGGNIESMSESQLDKLIQEQLPEGNMYRSDSKFYIGNVNEYGEKKTIQKNGNDKDKDVVDNKVIQTSTGSYSVKNKNRNKLITAGRDEWIEGTKNSPAASFLEPEERWQQQLKHREWLRINNRL